MPNRLAASTSPYLLQHADNPVDWFEWGEEAFAQARRRDVPLLVSVGYAACHWCHVMAHESFEDRATASLMNTFFVSVKVDREERPDVDAVYMAATQAITGSGGWPMTVFATPDGEPFYAGTYFPPRPLAGTPSFPQVLATLAAAWRDSRQELLAGAAQVRAALEPDVAGDLPRDGVLDETTVTGALTRLAAMFDPGRGGFGRAPKFPPSMVAECLLRHHARTGSADALLMAEQTLDRMARGGLYDQLGGGFARYSVDADWVVPHFEKMLPDNALLLRVYAHWWRVGGSATAARVVEETAGFLLRELRTARGGFASSLDADSAGRDGGTHEGAYYVWTPGELVDALGPDDAAWAAAAFSVAEAGTFEGGSSVLQLRADPDDDARWTGVRRRLLAARDQRPRPGRDDKVVAAWNGLAVAALADAGAILERAEWVSAARDAAQLLVDVHLTDLEPHPGPPHAGPTPTGPPHAGPPHAGPTPTGPPHAGPARQVRLARTSRDGVVGAAPGVLEDYADVAEGFLALYGATGDPVWVERAGTLLDSVLARFGDGNGGFFDTADDATDLVLARIRRPRDIGDGPTPAGQTATAGALVTYAALTGSTPHRAAAERALTEPLVVASRHPRAAGWALAVAEAMLDGPREVAVVGPPDDPGTLALRRVAVRAIAPGAVLALGDPGSGDPGSGDPGSGDPGSGDRRSTARPGAVRQPIPLLRNRPMLAGRPTAYVCRGFVCDNPVTQPADLAALLHP